MAKSSAIISRIIPARCWRTEILTEDLKDWVPAIKRLQQTRLKHNFIRSILTVHRQLV